MSLGPVPSGPHGARGNRARLAPHPAPTRTTGNMLALDPVRGEALLRGATSERSRDQPRDRSRRPPSPPLPWTTTLAHTHSHRVADARIAEDAGRVGRPRVHRDRHSSRGVGRSDHLRPLTCRRLRPWPLRPWPLRPWPLRPWPLRPWPAAHPSPWAPSWAVAVACSSGGAARNRRRRHSTWP